MTQDDVDRASGMAAWYARKSRQPELDSGTRADLKSAALEGLAQAHDRYEGDDDRERFWRFAAERVFGAIRDELRRLDHLTRTQRGNLVEQTDGVFVIEEAPWLNPESPMPLDAMIHDEQHGHLHRYGSLADPSDPFLAADDRDGLERALLLLSEQERELVLAVDYIGVTNDEMATRMLLTPGRTSQIRSAAWEKMRAALGTDFPLAA